MILSIITILRAILPKPSLCDEISDQITVTKPLARNQFVRSQLVDLARIFFISQNL